MDKRIIISVIVLLLTIFSGYGQSSDATKDIRYYMMDKKEKDFSVYEAGSGDYHFEVKK